MENKRKKADLKSRLVRDAGDVRKIDKSVTSGSSYIAKLNDACDRGDTAKIGVEKIKINDKKLADVLPTNIERTLNNSSTPKETDRRRRDEFLAKDPLTKMAEMKKIRENYTFRNKFSCVKGVNGECIKKNSDEKVGYENDRACTRPNEIIILASPTDSEMSPKDPLKCFVSQKDSPLKTVAWQKEPNRVSSGKTDMKGKTSPKTALAQQLIRRPIIKTITSKSDKTKVYKAVNFVDRKIQPTPLQINIPTDLKRSKETKPKPVVSKMSLKERRKKDKKKRSVRLPIVSPDVAVKIQSPPTEVAKWASADNHKKLYYEAWVDTTLAAISKKVKEKKFDKHKLMHTFQKALGDRPESSDIDYKLLLDEKYTGKIKVNKR